MAGGSLATPRRRLVAYCCAVAAPTLAVLGLGLYAAKQQRDALTAQTLATARLKEARIADRLERQLAADAELAIRALEDPSILAPALSGNVERHARLWPRVRDTLGRHPVARYAFFSDGSAVLYPPGAPSVPRPADELLREETAHGGTRALSAFASADQFEDATRFREAARAYAQAARLSVSPRVRALALSRTARAQERAGDRGAAAATYATIADDYRDQYDLSGRPYALVAALRLAAIAAAPRVAADPRVAAVSGHLLDGRWSIDATSAEYFLSELSPGAAKPDSAYLRALEFARRVQAGLRVPSSLQPATSYYAVLEGQPRHRVVYRLVPHTAGSEPWLAGVAVDLAWVEHDLLPAVAAAIAPGDTVGLASAGDTGTAVGPALSGLGVVLVPATTHGFWSGGVATYVLVTAAVLGLLILGVVLLLRDVTREAGSNRLRANLIGAVSHDLRTPLSVMRVYAETIADDPDLPADERRRYANIVAQETERLAQRISSAIDFARVESGARDYRLEPLLLQPIVREVADGYRPFLARHGFELHLSLDEDLPPVHVDRDAVSQALLNLLDNAFKYSGDCRRIDVRLVHAPGVAILEVQDGGQGIPPEDRSRILERFDRGSRTDRSGYGLGLFLVAHTMQGHGGHVAIDDGRPSGTVVRMVFSCPDEANDDAQGAGR